MPYEVVNGTSCYTNGNIGSNNGHSVHVVDFRSDTISRPTPEMRVAMASAEVGDDVFGEDPTVRRLEARAAQMLGKEDAAFVPSGTMANLIAIMVHCNKRSSELIAGDRSHTFLFEQGGSAAIAGVHTALVKNFDDGTFSLKELQSKIRIDPDCHLPYTSLIIVENTHNMCGGKPLPLEWLTELSTIANDHRIPVHMDGARVFNAAVAQNVPVSRIARDVQTVCFCLSKSLGCPVGSVLCGPKNFIKEAKRVRKALGGGMRQSGILAAAGLVALDKMVNRLKEDHDHIYQIAQAISDAKCDTFRVDLPSVQSNILMVYLDNTKISAQEFIQRLATVKSADAVKVSVKVMSRDNGCVRFTSYWEISNDDAKAAIAKIRLVIDEFKTNTTTKTIQ